MAKSWKIDVFFPQFHHMCSDQGNTTFPSLSNSQNGLNATSKRWPSKSLK